LEAPDALALEDAIIFAGYPDIQIRKFKNAAGIELIRSDKGFIELGFPQFNYPVRIILSPYANQFRLKKFIGTENEEEELRSVLEMYWNQLADKYFDNSGVNLYCGHLFFVEENGMVPEETDDEKPILHIGGSQAIYSKNLPARVQYVALGHLHRKQTVSETPCPLVYCGSPVSYSFSEAGQKKYVSIVELEPAKSAVISYVELIKGKTLTRKTFDSIDKAVDWLLENQEMLVELTIVSDDYLSATDRKRLYNSHPNIISIIPVTKKQENSLSDKPEIDLNKSIGELFVEYFVSRNGQNPDHKLMDIFTEVLSSNADEIN